MADGNDNVIYSVTKAQARDSVECRWRLFQTKYCLILGSVLLVLVIARFLIYFFYDIGTWYEVYLFYPPLVVISLVSAVYYYSCYRRVIRVAEKCPVYRVTFNNVRQGSWFFRGKVYYIVSFDPGNGTIYRKTSTMFTASTYTLSPVTMEHYNNKEMYVMHDTGDDRIYVLELADVIILSPRT